MIKGLQPGVSVLDILCEIAEFVAHCKKDPKLVGFNVMISRHPGKSYILGKVDDSLQAKYVLPILIDYMDPIQRPIIANSIFRGLHGVDMTPEALEAEMVSKVDEYDG